MSGLGIKLEYIIFYLISFVITMIVLNKFLFKPLVKILSEREESIANAISERDEVQEKIAHFNEEAEKILNDAKSESRKIIELGREQVEPEKQKVLDAAQVMANDIVSKSKQESERIVNDAKFQAGQEALSIVQKILSKAMTNVKISEPEQVRILEGIINEKL